MSTQRLLVRLFLALGLALLGGGIAMGFLPHSALGVSCGSAFRGTGDARVADLTNALWMDDRHVDGSRSLAKFSEACSSSRSAARTPAVLLLVLGGVMLTAGVVLAAPAGRPTTRADA